METAVEGSTNEANFMTQVCCIVSVILQFPQDLLQQVLTCGQSPGNVEAALVGTTLEVHGHVTLTVEVAEPLAVFFVDELSVRVGDVCVISGSLYSELSAW